MGFHDPLTPAPDPADATADLPAAVLALRDSTEDAFLATGSQLIDIANLLGDAKLAAGSLDKLAQIDLLNQLRIEADRQAATLGVLASEFAETLSVIGRLAVDLTALGEDLHAIGRSVVTMRTVVLNARVTLASLKMRDRNLVSFADSGQTVVAEISDLLTGFGQTMDDILRAVDRTQKTVGQIDATMQADVLSAFRALMHDLEGFESGIRAVSGRGAELAGKLQSLIDATSRAVSGLQVGDRTRQELDHVAVILSDPEGNDPVFLALSAALLQTAAESHGAMVEQLQNSVSEMAAGLKDLVEGHLAGFFNGPGQTVEAAALIQGCEDLGSAIAALQPMQELMNDLGQTMSDAFDAFRDLISQGEGVQDSTHLIGINAVLSCMRLGQDGAALKVVAEQLQVVSRDVGERFATIRTVLSGISLLGDQITSGTSRLVQQSIEVPEQLIGSIVPMVRSVVGYLEPAEAAISRLQHRLSDLSFDFGPANRHRKALDDLSARLPMTAPPPASAHLSDARLGQVFAMFTMEAERDAFRAVLPDRAVTSPPQAAPDTASQEDDSFFF
jgi:methyl-accepting chemotaxis protein